MASSKDMVSNRATGSNRATAADPSTEAILNNRGTVARMELLRAGMVGISRLRLRNMGLGLEGARRWGWVVGCWVG